LLWLLSALFLVVGLPFFVVASTGPLLQKWFSQSGQATAGDPYFLYSASNLGSLLGLLAYPVLLEPHLRLPHQSRLWAIGYAAMALCILGCGGVAWRARRSRLQNQSAAASEAGQDLRVLGAPPGEIITLSKRVRWLAVAFVPSSLMLGVTSYLATDIAGIPLLWIIPLSIYLLSFILVFAAGGFYQRPGCDGCCHRLRSGSFSDSQPGHASGLVGDLDAPVLFVSRRNGVSRATGPGTAGHTAPD